MINYGCKYLEHIGDGKVKCHIDGSIRTIGRGCGGRWHCKKYKLLCGRKSKNGFTICDKSIRERD